MTLHDLFYESREVLTDILFKAGIPAVIAALEWFTKTIPVLMLWVSFAYACLQLYVLVRDKVRRKTPQADSEIGPQAQRRPD